MVDANNVKLEHIYSGIIGLAVGDALGVPVDLNSIKGENNKDEV